MKSDGEGRMIISGNTVPGTDSELFGFAERFLNLEGALVENNGVGLDALVPEELQALLGTPEHIRIMGGEVASSIHDGCQVMGYGSPLLDRMIEAALQKIPLLFCRLEFDYIKSGGFDRLLRDQLAFYGAVAEIETIAEVLTDYVLVACRYKAQSDEQKEGLVQMMLNSDTKKLVPDMAEAIDNAVCRMIFIEDFEPRETNIFSNLGENIERHAKRLLQDHLKPFQESMNRRFKRDAHNLEEYYSSLETEMLKSLENPALSDNARKDRRIKIEALPAELARKTDDLFKKYSIKVSMTPTAAMILRSPAKKIICKLSIGKKNIRFSLTYNPVIQAIEPPACTRCEKSIRHIHVGSELELLCLECRQRF
jgi:hypothetical protein